MKRLEIALPAFVVIFAATMFAQTPAITSISPTSGPSIGGTSVTLQGSNFVAGATVGFGGVAATKVTVVSSSSITAVTPANSAGSVNVIVTNPNGQSGDLYSSQTPVTNPGFESGSTGWTALGASAVTVVTNAAGAHSGNDYAQVTAPAGVQVSYMALLSGSSEYLPVNPGDIISFGGWAYRVTGDGRARWGIEISDVNKANAIYESATPANVTVSSWTQETGTYTIPSGKAYIRFYCQITANTVNAQANFDDAILQRSVPGGGFTYTSNTPPTVTSVSPASGPVSGGTSVNLSGTNFQPGATVTIGGTPLSNVVVVNSGTITGTTEAEVAGNADVVVTNPNKLTGTLAAMVHNQSFEAGGTSWVFAGTGTGTVVNNVTNAHIGTYYAQLTSPKSGHPIYYSANSGGTSMYYPVNPGDQITFGGYAYRSAGDGEARWAIEITNSSKANPIYVAAPPYNAAVPQWQLQQGTYTIASGQAYVRLYCEIVSNTVAATAWFDDAVLQRTPEGTYGYSFVSPPAVNSVAPNWGAPEGGTTRTVYGTGFQTGATVMVGGVAATNVVVNSANAIAFFAPTESAGAVNIIVNNPDTQTGTATNAYTYKVPPAPPAAMSAVHHIIFTFQENRSFDSYFGMMNQYRANNGVNDNAVNGLPLTTSLKDIAGQAILPFHIQTECMENTQPSWNASHVDYDNGLMDDFMLTGNYFASPSTYDPNGTRTMGYYDWTDLPDYYALAFQFATSDSFFSSVMGPTGANRAYTFAATSLGYVGDPQSPTGGLPNLTIFDLLDQAGVSWRYYYQNATPSWITEWSTYNRDSSKIVPISGYYNDVKDESTFPQVIFIEENGNLDEHPKPNPGTTGADQNIQNGAAQMAGIINALFASPSWTSSMFIMSYDEGGGVRDHVAPPAMPAPDGYPPQLAASDLPGLFNQAGFRVPLIVVSPWTPPHFVSHVVRDHTSILKLIETRFSLPPLTARDAAADNMTEFFNFTTPSWTVPPTLPAQPTSGACQLNLEAAPGQ